MEELIYNIEYMRRKIKQQTCQAVKIDGKLCCGRIIEDGLFCVFHQNYCMFCRRDVIKIGNKCSDCYTKFVLDYCFK